MPSFSEAQLLNPIEFQRLFDALQSEHEMMRAEIEQELEDTALPPPNFRFANPQSFVCCRSCAHVWQASRTAILRCDRHHRVVRVSCLCDDWSRANV